MSKFTIASISLFLLTFCKSPSDGSSTELPTDKSSSEEIDVYANPNSFSGAKLKIGDTAPLIRASKWYNSEEIGSFEKGKVYVVEFWASWCQPCRKSIPHLNKLSKEFKDELVVIGVAASETNGSKKLETLLKRLKDNLTYPVAYVENPETFKDYMVAANNTGLPWAFIIGRDGKVVWWGQPFFSQFEPTLRSVLSGTHLRDDGSTPVHASADIMKTGWDLQEKYWEAYSDEMWEVADSLGYKLLETESEVFYYEVASLFEIQYLNLDREEEAIALAKKLKKGMMADKPEGLSLIAWAIKEAETPHESHIAFGIEVAQQVIQFTAGENPATKVLLAELYLKNDESEKAKGILEQIDSRLIDDEDLQKKVDDLLSS